ncbi:4-hydroxy-tetrahydrodipicolinate reductase [Sphingobium faniae]|nr:4-hydroxy-tetrahydrodipicolinate reductase [Sphingobium faniae]
MTNKPSFKPLRVAVVGPGGIGGACIKEILREPALDLVAVLAFNPASAGKDAGELVGKPSTGITVTNDVESFLAVPADCVVYAGAPPFDTFMEDLAVRLLESGCNVISSTGFFFPPAQGEESLRRLEDACRRGNASLHGTGENPGFMLERLAVTASAVANTIERISVEEAVDCSRIVGEAMKQFGFGRDPAEMQAGGPLDPVWRKYLFVESVHQTGVQLFGERPDRVEHKPSYHPAQETIELPIMTIEPGQVGIINHRFVGFYGDDPKISLEVTWYLRRQDAPFDNIGSSDHWRIEIEGKPTSIRIDAAALASVDRNSELHEGDPTIPSYYITAALITQAIPVVCAAPAGIVYPQFFSHGGTLQKFRNGQSS